MPPSHGRGSTIKVLLPIEAACMPAVHPLAPPPATMTSNCSQRQDVMQSSPRRIARKSVFFINCKITEAFLHFHPVAVVNLVTDPFCNIFSSRVERQKFVQIAMVQITVDTAFYLREIHHHSVAVKFLGFAEYLDCPVVAVQLAAFAGVGECQRMAGRNLHSLFNIIHDLKFFLQ